MSSIYQMRENPDIYGRDPDKQVVLIDDGEDPPDRHLKWGWFAGFFNCGYPLNDKYADGYQPLFTIHVDEAGKVGADVTWAKLWIYVSSRTGTPQSYLNYLRKCLRISGDDPTWYCVNEGGDDEADWTCYRHSENAWNTGWAGGLGSDYASSPAQVSFYGPAATGWFSITITAIVADALDNHSGVVNMLMNPPTTLATAFTFTDQLTEGGDRSNVPYIEVEWAAAAAAKVWVMMF